MLILPGVGLSRRTESVEVRGPLHLAHQHRAALRRYLCLALDRASIDAFEIARVITPLLAGLKAAGSVAIDLAPWLFARVALLIARTGVAAFCAAEQDDEGEGKGESGESDVEAKGGGDTPPASSATVARATGATAGAGDGAPVPTSGSSAWSTRADGKCAP